MTSSTGVRPLRIAQIAPLWTSVPPRTYGGAELMVHWLTEELVRRGHQVTLFASGDSVTAATLHPVCERNLVAAMERGEAFTYEPYAAAAIAEALLRDDDFDVVHCHLGASTIPLSVLSRTPVVHTLHTDLEAIDELWALRAVPPGADRRHQPLAGVEPLGRQVQQHPGDSPRLRLRYLRGLVGARRVPRLPRTNGTA